MKVALYARVSTEDKNQNPETQLLRMREFCERAGWEIYDEYIDYARAKDYRRRKNWARMQKDARQYRVQMILVAQLDRAFRSVVECANTVQEWFDRDIRFKCLREEAIDTTTSAGRFILHIMVAVAELESALIGERISAGIRRIKKEGKGWGRKPLAVDIDKITKVLGSEKTLSSAARKLKIDRQTIRRRCRDHGLDAIELLCK